MQERKTPDIFVMDDPKSVYSEAFRVLRTNLQFTSVDKPLKKILVTSSVPREGKSTTIANLAVSFAQTGIHVLLIDADLRRPTNHKIFYLENYKGLSNLLAESLPLDSVIQREVVPGLDVLTSGPIPPNPAEILHSEKMKHFMANVSSQYDIVLVDSPPVTSVADASILSSYVDGCLLVISAGHTDREAAMLAKEQLEKVGAKVLGAVLNKVQQSHGSYYYYYYYYGQDGVGKKEKRKKRRGAKHFSHDIPSGT